MSTRTRAPRWLTSAFAVTIAGVVGWGVLPPTAASADSAPTAPSSPATPVTVSSDALPAPQIGSGIRHETGEEKNAGDREGAGVVRDQVVIGSTVYVGGDFHRARPAGAGPGEKVVDRSNFLAYDLETGALLPLSISFNAGILSFAVSPDRKTLYAAGDFTSVNGQQRNKVAAIDVATGTLVETFRPVVNARVSDIAVTSTAVYLAGAFRSVAPRPKSGTDPVLRVSFAAVAPLTGDVLPWAPQPGIGGPTTKVEGKALLVSPTGDKVIVAGRFESMNGSSNPGRGMAALHPTKATNLPWKVNELVRNGTDHSSILDLSSDGTSVYGSAYQMRRVGAERFNEGTFKASWTDGTPEWLSDCHGDTYGVIPFKGAVYTAGHAHYCVGVGGFDDNQWSVTSNNYHRALAFSVATTRTLAPYTRDDMYANYAGKPSPSLLDWYPDFAVGEFTGSTQGPWDVTAAGKYVLYGGEFPSVNGKKQQGLVRFAVPTSAPNGDGPQLSGNDMKPTAENVAGGAVRLTWLANYDRDNASLTYEIMRTVGSRTESIGTVTSESRFWKRPSLEFVDRSAPSGASVQYRIKTIDPFSNMTTGSPVSIAVPGAPTAGYDQAVLKDAPTAYWPLNEASGTTGADLAGTDPQQITGATRGVVGPIVGSKATRFGGTSASYSSSQIRKPAPDRYSSELWFSTTSKQGGKLFGFAGGTAPDAPATERHIYLDDSGQVTYGASDAASAGAVVTSRPGFNDGKWHHVVTTLGSNGMNLYIDGSKIGGVPRVTSGLAYSGFWNIGGHVNTWGGRGSSNFIAGSISNVAVYDRELSEQSIQAHRKAMTPPVAPKNTAPTASFTTAAKDLTVAVDAAASADPDGSIVSYAWSFGDGTTGAGKTAPKVYAKAGTYTVTLTTTDDAGATSTTTKTVTVTAPAAAAGTVLAADAFARTASSSWGTAQTGGSWSLGGGNTGFSVASPRGRIVNAAGQTRTALLPTVASTRTDSVVSFTLDSTSTTGQSVSLIGRSVGTDSYSARVMTQAGGLQLQILRGTTTLKAVNLTGVTYAKGTKVIVRFQALGSGTTTLNAKAWTGTTEPTAWQATVTDTTPALQTAGGVGLSLSTGAGTAATTAAFSGYTVKAR
jgi:PKD repeat protein